MSQLPSTPFKSTMDLLSSSMEEVSKLLSPNSETYRTRLEDIDTQGAGGEIDHVIDESQDVNWDSSDKGLDSSPKRENMINEGPLVKLHYVDDDAGKNECGGILFDHLRVCIKDV